MKTMIYIAAILIIILALLFYKRESFTMSLGNYGKPISKMCMETTPQIREIPNSEGRDYVACNACSLFCPDTTNCWKCQQKLNYPGVMD